ncbi:class I SAM-dependent methyltransferase [Catenovulum sp. SM1970]|uniref:class I SAM-dependent methyltransferase n=1 Tax=Marinifaba aquimaris TaxID=2741323 RepID=UPI001571645E|nr:class I SAM-dependent methyltransferase [Marinifaba aquimaris]NTS75421.1 class I SAM-dependent methyltransferase [Marinifaba aquimaris]
MKTFTKHALSVGLALTCTISLANAAESSQTSSLKQSTSQVLNKAQSKKLDAVLAAQSDEHKARHQSRHPKETLSFFGIEPGMTVVEALPGGGWYSKVIAPYLGKEGKLIGVNYEDSLWSNFTWASEDFIKDRIGRTKTFPSQVKEWTPVNTPKAESYTFGTFPETMSDSVDAVLYIRALHNLNRFNDNGQYLDTALAETHRILKKGGVVGVVQHSSDVSGLKGDTGYLNKADVIAAMEKAGLKLVDESDINANPKDQPKADEIVWRLPPTLLNAKDDEAKKKALEAIGESNRMTLLFKKI